MENYRLIELLKEIKELVKGNFKQDKWLNMKEACKYTNCSDATLRRAVKRNHLNASKRLGKFLFKVSSLESWLNAK